MGPDRTAARRPVAGGAAATGFYRPTEFEVAVSWVHGRLTGGSVRAATVPVVRALEDVIRPHFLAGTVYVAFSGGRDSSVLLGTATRLARREGFADPVPVTERYPDVPEADESEWQQQVVDHLALSDWLRVDCSADTDLLGDVGQAGLRQYGLIWPPALHLKTGLLRMLGGGALLTGEGGDEVFGVHRATAWHHAHLRSRADASRRVGWSRVVRSALPGPLRAREHRRALECQQMQPWLRPHIRGPHERLLAADHAAEPLRWDRSVLALARRRGAAVTSHNYRLLAAEHGVVVDQPLLDIRFLQAVAGVGRWTGFASRTSAMLALFGGVVPDAVLRRRTKALFNKAFFGPAARDFARGWDGAGVDSDWVDVDRLRSEWLAATPSSLTSALLQQAWVGSRRVGVPA